jgi:proteasome accessory factor C
MSINQRLSRLIDLVPYISKHQGIAIEDLAGKFQISVRELEKDLWLLYCCGLPGQTPLELMEFTFEDGFVTVRNADELKHPRSLTQVEIATLIMGLEIIAKQGEIQNPIAANLANRLREMIRGEISIEPDHSQIYMPEILQAIQRNQLLRIEYQGKVREIIPFETYMENGSFYLKSHCKLANARRTFKVNRITSLELLEAKELAPNDVVSADVKEKALIETHSNSRSVREVFGSTEEITYFSKEWALREVMAFGGAVEVITAELRSEIATRAQAGKNLYLG